MRRMLGSILLTLALILVVLTSAFGVLFVLQPTSFRIARTRTISAPPARIAGLLGDVRSLASLEPHFGSTDPTATVTFSPVTTGVGAWMELHGEAGTSRLTLVSVSDARVELENENDGAPDGAELTFELRPVEAGTEVTLVLSNDLHGVGRALWPFLDLEGLVAPRMESTLNHLDAAARAP
jgi:hypothetical protein